MKLVKNDTVLFLGDSITDCDRDRQDPHDLGHGFARLVADQLAETFPTAGFTFYNRGIGGNKAADVLARLQEDCLQLAPDVLVFMIGINDTWHNAGGPDFGSEAAATSFEATYRQILEQVTLQGITRIFLLEPFVLPYPEDRQTWRIDLDPKIQIVRHLAAAFHCQLLPLDGLFAEAAVASSPQALTGDDGVHPTPAGHALIADQLMARLAFSSEG
ncbi:hypothetical protein IGI71_000256 [Enterococcus sp. DIV1279b]|uniref:SGNH/GDSL hydrolase family protein n=1 Tax=Enterococcus sp. DIV1279b TaxID=2774663 RepID=UPI003D2FD1A7